MPSLLLTPRGLRLTHRFFAMSYFFTRDAAEGDGSDYDPHVGPYCCPTCRRWMSARDERTVVEGVAYCDALCAPEPEHAPVVADVQARTLEVFAAQTGLRHAA